MAEQSLDLVAPDPATDANSGESAVSEAIASSPTTARWLELRLPAAPSSVRSLRSALRTFLDGTGISPGDLDDLLLVACEAATNAIEHAQRPTTPYLDVVLDVRGGSLTITVCDYGRWREGPVGKYRGRGLMLMSALADVSVRPRPEGTTVTIRSSLAATGSGDGS